MAVEPTLSPRLLRYNAIDSFGTLEAWNNVEAELKKQQFYDNYRFSMEMLPAFLYIQQRGIFVDRDGIEAAKQKVQGELDEAISELHREVGGPLNANSPKQVGNYFYDTLGIPEYKKEGKRTVDDRAMQRLAKGTASRAPIRAAYLVQRVRGLNKYLGTYLEIAFDRDGRFRCSVNPRGTWTGRISTSKTIYETGMNQQNLPPAFKHFLIPDPGMMMFEVDKAGAEWVVVAYLSGDANMIRVIEEGKDPHAFTGSQMFGVPEEAIKEESYYVGHSTDPFELEQLRRKHCPWVLNLPFFTRNMALRQAGKKANHGLNYDEGPRGFALHNEMREDDARRIVHMYHDIYPNIRKVYYERVKQDLSNSRTITNCFGRSFKFYDKWGDRLMKQAYACLPQSTVVDMVNRGIKAIYQSEEFPETEPLTQVHDSLLGQHPVDDLEGMARMLKFVDSAMSPEVEYYGRTFTVKTDAKVSCKSWADMTEIKQIHTQSVEDVHKVCMDEFARAA